MKICMIGMGSIGSRHVRNLGEELNKRGYSYVIDAVRSRNKPLEPLMRGLISTEYESIDQLEEDYDIIFITNPTSLHFSTIKKAVEKTRNMFIEKPVFDHCNYKLHEIPWKKGGIYYVACPLRYSPVISYLKEALNGERVYSLRAISSSYLPDWRPGTDYRTVYSAKKELGGGVSLDLIHEWDYITYLFGFPNQVFHIAGKYSDLEINSDDLSVYIGRYPDKLAEVHLDYLGRETRRTLELYCRDYVITGDFIGLTIAYKGSVEKTIRLEKEDIYKKEMAYFLDIMEKKVKNHNPVEHARNVLELSFGPCPKNIDRKGILG